MYVTLLQLEITSIDTQDHSLQESNVAEIQWKISMIGQLLSTMAMS